MKNDTKLNDWMMGTKVLECSPFFFTNISLIIKKKGVVKGLINLINQCSFIHTNQSRNRSISQMIYIFNVLRF